MSVCRDCSGSHSSVYYRDEKDDRGERERRLGVLYETVIDLSLVMLETSRSLIVVQKQDGNHRKLLNGDQQVEMFLTYKDQ